MSLSMEKALPGDLIVRIFSWVLSGKDFVRISLVCKAFRHHTREEILWEELCALTNPVPLKKTQFPKSFASMYKYTLHEGSGLLGLWMINHFSNTMDTRESSRNLIYSTLSISCDHIVFFSILPGAASVSATPLFRLVFNTGTNNYECQQLCAENQRLYTTTVKRLEELDGIFESVGTIRGEVVKHCVERTDADGKSTEWIPVSWFSLKHKRLSVHFEVGKLSTFYNTMSFEPPCGAVAAEPTSEGAFQWFFTSPPRRDVIPADELGLDTTSSCTSSTQRRSFLPPMTGAVSSLLGLTRLFSSSSTSSTSLTSSSSPSSLKPVRLYRIPRVPWPLAPSPRRIDPQADARHSSALTNTSVTSTPTPHDDPEPRHPLEGYYQGNFPGDGLELQCVRRFGHELRCAKITGDNHVPAGEITFIVRLDDKVAVGGGLAPDLSAFGLSHIARDYRCYNAVQQIAFPNFRSPLLAKAVCYLRREGGGGDGGVWDVGSDFPCDILLLWFEGNSLLHLRRCEWLCEPW